MQHGSNQGLAVQDVAALRGDRVVLRGVTFQVSGGGAAVLLGPNGAGKTTLLRILAGLSRPDAGQVRWNGAPVDCVGWLSSQDAVKPGLTVAENLAFAASLSGRDPGAALAALDLLPLADLPARMLSTGQRRRLALARLLLSDAALWLLDEPTLGLDAASVARLEAMLARHRAHGGVVVVATHLALSLPDAQAVRL